MDRAAPSIQETAGGEADVWQTLLKLEAWPGPVPATPPRTTIPSLPWSCMSVPILLTEQPSPLTRGPTADAAEGGPQPQPSPPRSTPAVTLRS